jgi:adenylate cyclase
MQDLDDHGFPSRAWVILSGHENSTSTALKHLPELYVWYFVLCHANTHLARDAQAIDWCFKSIATGKTFWFAYVDLASAYAWRGQNAEAAAAVAELLKLRPGYTVRQLAQEGLGFSNNPTFRKEYQRIIEGARQAGLPES